MDPFKNEVEQERKMQEARRPEGMPEGFPGGGPGMGGGRPPMGDPGMMPPSDEEMEKFYTKQDKNLQKILTAEQYGKWRSKHPAEQLPMPEHEWNR